jgi:hypothetical protein
MTFPALRPRIPAYGHTGGISRIIAGVFGSGTPQPQVGAASPNPVYAYHEGDIFRPGTENFVFESLLELPLTAWWGAGSGIRQGTPYPVNAWPVFASEIPTVSRPTVTRAGLGGLQAGAFVQQPLLDRFSG